MSKPPPAQRLRPIAVVAAFLAAWMASAAPLRSAENEQASEVLRERAYREASQGFIESHAFCRSTFAYVAQCLGRREHEAPLDEPSAMLKAEVIEGAKKLAVREEGLYEKTGTSWPEFDAERRKGRATAVGTGLPCDAFLETKRAQIDQCRELLAHPGERFQSTFDAAVARLGKEETVQENANAAKAAGDATPSVPSGGEASAATDKGSTPARVKAGRQRGIAAKVTRKAEARPVRSTKFKASDGRSGQTAGGK